MGRARQRKHSRRRASAVPSPHKSIGIMDTPPVTPQERAEVVNLTLSSIPDPFDHGDQHLHLQPPSPATPGCVSESNIISTPSAAVAYPSPSPAWESKDDSRRSFTRASTTGLGPVPTSSPAATSSRAPLPCSAQPVLGSQEEQRESLVANLRLDLIPPVRAQGLSALAATPMPSPSPGALLSPSLASGIQTPPTTVAPHQQQQRPTVVATRAFFSPFENIAVDESLSSETAESPPLLAGEGPCSSRSGVSGIFELEIGSPMVFGGGRVDSQLPPGQPEESTVTSASAAAFASRGKEMEEKGKEAEDGEAEDHEKDSSTTPSLGSYQPMPGPWGRLQQVIDEIKVLSPHDDDDYGSEPSSSLHTRPLPPSPGGLGPPSPSTTPSTEERKGFARYGAPSDPASREHSYPPHPTATSSPVPVATVTSPPTPVASAGNTPAASAGSTSTPFSQQPSTRPSEPLLAVEEQLRSAGEARKEPVAAAAKVASSAAAAGMVEEEPQPAPGGALGASLSAGAAFGESEAGIPASESETWMRGASGEGFGGGQLGVDLGIPDEVEEAGEVTSGVVQPDAGRGSVGERILRAAEAISESPQLRRAAGAAATVVSAATNTARVHFTVTSRTLGKVLMASAISFEEFVAEQLREDGSGRVLRTEGATGLRVPRGDTLTQTFLVSPGCHLVWEFRVKNHDLGFALRRRTQAIGGATEQDIFEMKRYKSGETFQGRWTAERHTTTVVVMVWDNSYSCLRPKTLAYKAQVVQPGIDPTAPPPPPPPTPADTRSAQTPTRHMFGGGGGGGNEGGGAGSLSGDTEAFAIEESEGEEPYISATSGRGEAAGGGSMSLGESAHGWQSTKHNDFEGSKGEGEGIQEGGAPETIKIEDFLAMPGRGGPEGDDA